MKTSLVKLFAHLKNLRFKALLLIAGLLFIVSPTWASVFFQQVGTKEGWPNFPQTPQAHGTISDVTSPAYQGNNAIKFTQTWIPNYTGRYHSEVDYQGTQFTGQTRYYGLSLFLPANWNSADSKVAIQQWAGTGPWIIMEVRGTNLVILPHIAGITTLAPITPGQWMHIVTQITDDANGTMVIWVNGVIVHTFNGNLVAPAPNGEIRWSCGEYVTGWTGVTTQPSPSYRELYEDHYRIATTYAEAEPTNWNEPGIVTIPSAPSNLVATAISTSQINLSWTDNSNNEDNFQIDRSLDNSTWTALVTLATNTTSYSNTGLTAGTKYFYRVSAINAAGSSGFATASATTTQSGAESIWKEAESGTMSSPMTVQSDVNASGGKYIMSSLKTTTPPSTGYSVISFTAVGGSYRMWFRTIMPSTSANSFFYRFDSGSWVTWNVDADVSTAWLWNPVSTISLTAGSHTLTIAYREPGAKLDKILLTTDASLTPTGIGGTATDISVTPQPAAMLEETAAATTSTVFSVHTVSEVRSNPNPFNPSTIISYNLQAAGQVRIAIYDISGREIMTLIDGYQNAGIHQITWDASSVRGRQLASGMYLARMTAGSFTQTIKLLLMK